MSGGGLRRVSGGAFPSPEEFDAILDRAIDGYYREELRKFREDIRQNRLGLAPKRRGPGPPLYRFGVYLASWRYTRSGSSVRIRPTGMNGKLSNEALGEMLEYGYGDVPARPHMRVLALRVQRNARREIRRRVLDELRRNH